jgi:LPXTG-motif cell wall-anchored protein
MGWNRNRIARAAALSAAMTMVVASPELAGASDAETKDATQIEASAEVEAGAEVEVEDEIEAETEVDARTEAEVEEEAAAEAGADAEAHVEERTDLEADVDVEAGADVETGADVDVDANRGAEGDKGGRGADDDVNAPMPGAGATVAVEAADCDSFTVVSSKDLSNVVVVYADGEHHKADGLSGTEWTFTGDVQSVAGVYIKSGANHSGEGPGYGEWKDVVLTADCELATDIDTGTETETEVDADIEVDNEAETDTQVGGEVEVDTDTQVGGEVEADTDAHADVGGESEVRTDAPGSSPMPSGLVASNAAGTEVLGDVTTRPYTDAAMSSGSTLPRTGADSKALLPLGGALVLGGIALDLLSRRRQAAANDVR